MIWNKDNSFNLSSRVEKKLVLRKKNILRVLREKPDISSVEIASETKYLIPSVIKMLGELTANGYIIESGVGRSSGGRKPTLYKIKNDAAYFLGIDFGRASLRFSLMDFTGSPICKKSIRIYSEITKEELLAHFDIIPVICDDVNIDIKMINGIGLTVPESSERDSFDRIYPFNIRINELTSYIKQQYNRPLYILNEPQALILGEKYFGKWQHFENVIAVSVGYSLEMGIMINGELYTGTNQHAGEIGHIKIQDFSYPCFCGGNGCLRTFASSAGVVEAVESKMKAGAHSALKNENVINGKLVNQYAEQGDSLCIDVLETAGKNIGKTIATAINFFNPELVILSGRMVTSSSIVSSTIKTHILKGIHPKNAADMTLEISKLDEFASAMAVALLPLNDIFEYHPEEVIQLI